METNKRLEKCVKKVEEVIGAIDFANGEPKGLYQPMQYILDLSGKRLRPLIALLSYQMFAPEEQEPAVYPIMRAVELFHNFTLLHDDVMDDALMRRGKPTVYHKWGANTAILSGDSMLIEAYKELETLPSASLAIILPIFNQMAIAVCAGQQYDMEFEDKAIGEVSLQDYMKMIRLKTSCLFSATAEMAARLAGASDQSVQHLAMAVETMGLAFQVQDDYLDIFSDHYFGKKRGGDILERKRTYLLILAHNKAPQKLEDALTILDEEERISAVAQLYEELGIKRATEEEVERLSHEAIQRLSMIGLPEKSIAPLKKIFAHLIGRTV